MNIRPIGAELFLADGQTEVMKLTDAFRSFANPPNKAPKKIHSSLNRNGSVTSLNIRSLSLGRTR